MFSKTKDLRKKKGNRAGIVVSTPGEADLLVAGLDKKETVRFQHKTFFHGMLGGDTPVVICVCGVGKTNAAHGTTLILELFGPSHVYSIGVAGAYPGSGLDVGAVAVAENEFYGDEGLVTETGFHTIEALGLPLVSVAGTTYYNEFPMFVPEALTVAGSKGNFVSVSTCTGTLAGALDMERRFNAICENMEGAAVAHVCCLNSTPVSEVRGISNVIGNREAAPLEKSGIRIASKKAQQLLLRSI